MICTLMILKDRIPRILKPTKENFLIISLLFIFVLFGVNTYDCNLAGEEPFNGFCYKITPSTNSWRLKEAACKSLKSNAHMLSIHSKAENDFIQNNFQSGDYHLGANTRMTADYFFTDGTIVNYHNWDTNHPEASGNTYLHSCSKIKIENGVSAVWRGSTCSSVLATICKWPLDDSTSLWDDVEIIGMTSPLFNYLGNGREDFLFTNKPPLPENFSWKCIRAVSNGGLGGHLYSPIDGQCFYITEDSQVTYEDSYYQCKSWNENATLATVSSRYQQMTLTRHTLDSNDGLWIGLNNIKHYGEFLWMGVGHQVNTRGDYSYLKDFENSIQIHDESCVYISTTEASTGPYHDSCSGFHYQVCSVRMDLNNPNEILVTPDHWKNVEITSTPDYRITCSYDNRECPGDDNRYAWHCLNNGDFVYNGRCNVLKNSPSTWSTAYDGCKGDNVRKTFLGTLGDDNEGLIVSGLLGGSHFWIGLNDIYREGVFTWMDGDLLGGYDKTDDKGYSNSKNVFFYNSGSLLWTYDGGASTYNYLCQYIICNPLSICGESSWENIMYDANAGFGSGQVTCEYETVSCPSDYFTQWGGAQSLGTWECANFGGVPINDKCVIYVESTVKSWYQWEAYCKTTYGDGAHLLALPGDGEPYLSDIEYYLHITVPAGEKWIGINRIADFSRWDFTAGDTYSESFPWSIQGSGICGYLSTTSNVGYSQSCTNGELAAYCEFPLDRELDEWDNVVYQNPLVINCPFLSMPCPEVYQYCYGYHYLDPNVCGGNGLYSFNTNAEHGKCTSYNYCECNADYLPGSVVNDENNNCRHWNCNSKYHLDLDNGCTDGKACIDRDYCHCFNQHNVNCSIWECDGILYTNHSHVCSGHGDCVFNKDLYDQKCKCQPGYHGKNCEIQKCHGIFSNHSNVCFGHGKCNDINKCECETRYSESQCQKWDCWGFNNSDGSACFSRGRCVDVDRCECQFLSSGSKCESDFSFLFISGIAVSVMVFICCILAVVVIVVFIVLKFTLWSGKGSKLSKIETPEQKQEEKSEKKGKKKKKFNLFGKKKNKKGFENQVKLLEKENEEKDAKEMASLIINKSLFIIDFEDIKLSEIIGSGGSDSQVFRGNWKDMDVAIKLYKTMNLSQSQNFEEFEREVQVLSMLNHPNIVTFYGCSLKPPKVGIVFEYCGGGDLIHFYSIIKCDSEEEKKKFPFLSGVELTVNLKMKFIDQIAQSMRFLHLKNCYHRDLKCGNVLVDKSLNAKLTDFGLSKFMLNQKNANKKTQRIGTSHYMAPEVCLGKDYSEKCDVFSFGMMIYEILTEDFDPFPDVHNVELKIANNPEYRPKKVKVEGVYDKWIVDLMRSCYNHEPQDRPSFGEICKIVEKNWNEN